MTLAFTAAVLAFSLTSRTPFSSAPFSRAHVPVAFLEPEDFALDKIEIASSPENTWLRTSSGLRYKEVKVVRDSPVPSPGDIVELAYTASLSDGRTVDATLEGRPLKFIVGQNDTLPLFEEMTAGMSVGSTRQVIVPASPSDSNMERESLQFDLELKAIPTGKDAIAFRLARALPGVIRTAVLLSFLPDVLSFVGILPHTTPSMSQPGFGAVDILSTPSDAHAMALSSTAAPLVDVANRWAAEGLQGLF